MFFSISLLGDRVGMQTALATLMCLTLLSTSNVVLAQGSSTSPQGEMNEFEFVQLLTQLDLNCKGASESTQDKLIENFAYEVQGKTLTATAHIIGFDEKYFFDVFPRRKYHGGVDDDTFNIMTECGVFLNVWMLYRERAILHRDVLDVLDNLNLWSISDLEEFFYKPSRSYKKKKKQLRRLLEPFDNLPSRVIRLGKAYPDGALEFFGYTTNSISFDDLRIGHKISIRGDVLGITPEGKVFLFLRSIKPEK